MPFDLNMLDNRKELETEAWAVLIGCVPELELPLRDHIQWSELFLPSMANRLALGFLQYQRQKNKSGFLTPSQIAGIATEPTTYPRTALGLPIDIDEVSGLYLFIDLADAKVLKVGQAEGLRKRLVAHFRHGNQSTPSNLRDHCNAYWGWPACIKARQIVAILLPMPNGSEIDRCFVESGLQSLLSPIMP